MRSNEELRSLIPGKLFLRRRYAVHRLQGQRNEERRKEARQYVQADIAAELCASTLIVAITKSQYLIARSVKDVRNVRQDLAAARQAWLDKGKSRTKELSEEMRAIFFAGEPRGERPRFPRPTAYVRCLAGNERRAPKSCSNRHAAWSITLTMDTYGHLFPGQEAEAVGKLGSCWDALRSICG